MKKWILGLALVACQPGWIMAADMHVKAPPRPPAAAYPVWSGFYIGAHVGYAWGDFDFRDPFIKINQPVLGLPGLILGVPLERTFDGTSFLGGVQAGVNAQFGSVVVGVEADASWMNLEGAFRSTFSALGGVITTSDSAGPSTVSSFTAPEASLSAVSRGKETSRSL
jgi:outer membrane immunogenic protein